MNREYTLSVSERQLLLFGVALSGALAFDSYRETRRCRDELREVVDWVEHLAEDEGEEE